MVQLNLGGVPETLGRYDKETIQDKPLTDAVCHSWHFFSQTPVSLNVFFVTDTMPLLLLSLRRCRMTSIDYNLLVLGG